MSRRMILRLSLAVLSLHVTAQAAGDNKIKINNTTILSVGNQTLHCDDAADNCRIPVNVSTQDNKCFIEFDFGKIDVAKGENWVLLTWLLIPKFPNDGFDYRFKAGNGIKITGGTLTPNEDLDVGRGKVGKNSRKKFRMLAPNGRINNMNYEFNLERKPNGGTWTSCGVEDPLIINNGN